MTAGSRPAGYRNSSPAIADPVLTARTICSSLVRDYLTDCFAAGHNRTARISATNYWNDKVPMFFHNFQGSTAERLAYYINERNWRGHFASIDYIWGKAKKSAADLFPRARRG